MNLVDNVTDHIIRRGKEVAHAFIDETLEALKYKDPMNGRTIESPLEQIFLIEWKFKEHERCLRFPFKLWPQFYSEKLTGKYFIDFLVSFFPGASDRFGKDLVYKAEFTPRLGIEIDGHEFHEKTKRQVEYQKGRERFLVSRGWKILRFAGTEIFHDPGKCVDEARCVAEETRKKYFEALTSFKEKKNA